MTMGTWAGMLRRLPVRRSRQQAAFKVDLDAAYNIFRREHVHAARNHQLVADLDGEPARIAPVFRVAVADRLTA